MKGWALESGGELLGADGLYAMPRIFYTRERARDHKHRYQRLCRGVVRVVRVEFEWPRIVGPEKMEVEK